MARRFKVIDGSQSSHCCFSYTIVDTTRPVMIGGNQYKDRFDPLCECFEEEDAVMICEALNKMEESK